MQRKQQKDKDLKKNDKKKNKSEEIEQLLAADEWKKEKWLHTRSLPLHEKFLIWQSFYKASRPLKPSVCCTLGFSMMDADGICHIDATHYSVEFHFTDINYDKEDEDRQLYLMHGWHGILNSIPPDVHAQFCFLNYFDHRKQNMSLVPNRPDEFNEIRREYQKIYHDLLGQRNGLTKEKTAVFTFEAANLTAAKEKISAFSEQLKQNFADIGSNARQSNGLERLRRLSYFLNPEPIQSLAKKDFEDEDIKDFISPQKIQFLGKYFLLDKKWGSCHVLKLVTSSLNDRFLTELLDIECEQIVSIHFDALEKEKAVRLIKGKLGDINSIKIDKQKAAVQEGYDMDIIPSDLNRNAQAAERILEKMEGGQTYFHVTIVLMQTAPTKKTLNKILETTESLIRKRSCEWDCLDSQQEQGLVSSLGIGQNQLSHYQRGLTTDNLGILIPFTTIQVFQKEGQYYGVNQLDGQIIRASRKKLKNPNGLILGPPSTGKSFFAKREWVDVFFTTEDDIILIDPEGEYAALVEALHGQVIRLAPNSKNHINMMDIDMFYLETGEHDEDTPLNTKRNFLLTIFETILHRRLSSIEESIVDRCVGHVYEPFMGCTKIQPEEMPLLQDLYEDMKIQPEPEAKALALSIEIYVTGSLSTYNQRTNVQLSNRLICFDISSLSERMRDTMLSIVQE